MNEVGAIATTKSHAGTGSLRVATNKGPVVGRLANGMRRFLGIPYAAPPVGPLRWRPPVEHARWTAPLDASAYRDVCAQDSTATRPGFGFRSESEDCLYLNIYTPAKFAADEKLPVMVWLPGGGLFMGGPPGYDPSAIVKAGRVIYVSISYRLGLFGFFSHPAINDEGHAAGNYGIMDQQFALRWVKDNIDGFGGDAGNVTLFGESAGGWSIWAHMASPGSTGLFEKAIIQSGTAAPLIATPSLQARERVGLDLAAAVGCTDQRAACLRAVPARTLLAANLMPPGVDGMGRFTIGLTVDGAVLPRALRDLFASGQFHRVPLINGTNHDEFTWFQANTELVTGHVLTAAEYPSVLGKIFGATAAAEVATLYPVECYPTPGFALAAAIGDSKFICSGGRMATRIVKQYVTDVYAFEFNVPDSPSPWPVASFPYRSGHTIELQYLFSGFRGGSGTACPLDAGQQRLAEEIVQYWTNFARKGTPNGGDLPFWPTYDVETDEFMSLETPTPQVTTSFGVRHHCDFWDRSADSLALY